MKYEAFKSEVFDYAARKGLKEFELFSVSSNEFEISVSKGEIERYKDAGSGGASFKVLKEGKCGYSYTERYDKTTAVKIVDDALENLSIIENADKDYIFTGNASYDEIGNYDMLFEKLDSDKKIENTLELERKILDSDPRIKMVPYCMYMNFSSTSNISNSYGVELSHTSGGGGAFAMALASENGATKTGFSFILTDNPDSLSVDLIAKKACEETLGKLGAKSISSGKYRALLRRDVFSSFLTLFTRMISAESVQKGFSLMKGKIGEKIFDEKVTIYDKNVFKGSMFNTPFDSQGVPTTDKVLVENGILKTYLHSLKTAVKDGVSPTGNAFRRSYKGKESISPINIIVEKGDSTFEQLTEALGNGVIITDVQGMHSGANPVSGDFSLGAEGFYVENGSIVHPVEQITVAGNLLNIFKRIIGMGNDVKIAPEFSQGIYTPSILIEEIDIAG